MYSDLPAALKTIYAEGTGFDRGGGAAVVGDFHRRAPLTVCRMTV
jgi:hypothetical protein